MGFASLRRLWDARYPFYCCGILVGIAVLWWPFSTQRDLSDWAAQLRKEGVPAQAIVYDRAVRTGNYKTPDSRTMYLHYDFAGSSRTGEVGCWAVCEPPGTPVQIWVNAADPTDFVADFGTLSGNRGRVQAGFGFAGAMLAVLCAGAAVGRRLRGRVHGGNAARRTADRVRPPRPHRAMPPAPRSGDRMSDMRHRNRRWRKHK